MFKIYSDYNEYLKANEYLKGNEYLKKRFDQFEINKNNTSHNSGFNYHYSKETLMSIEKEDEEVEIDYLNLEDISLNTKETSEVITIKELVNTIDHLIYTENEVTPLYYFFMDKIDSLPMINILTYKKAANSFYEEYKRYNTGNHSAYINIKGEWKQLSLNQFKESLKEVLLTSHKESNIDKLFKELNNLFVKDNFS
ncbi:hypothetical protein [Staphylococcus phage LY01]|nr:hypothetical protein [Staphylococcus phage LY01]